MAAGETQLVMSGEVVLNVSDSSENGGVIILGPGLRKENDKVFATKCGYLKKKGHSTFWVDNYQKHYVAARGECVLGIVTSKLGDSFKVDIGASYQATLSYLAFEGATKKNRPNIQVGDIVYAKLLEAHKEMEPELVCVDRYGKASGLGLPAEGGFLFQVSLNLVRKVLSPTCGLLKALGEHLKFEVAVGMNGRIWVKGLSVKETIIISNAISLAEFMTEEQIKVMVDKLMDAMRGF